MPHPQARALFVRVMLAKDGNPFEFQHDQTNVASQRAIMIVTLAVLRLQSLQHLTRSGEDFTASHGKM